MRSLMPLKFWPGIFLGALVVGCGQGDLTNNLPPEPGLEKPADTKKRPKVTKPPMAKPGGPMEIPR